MTFNDDLPFSPKLNKQIKKTLKMGDDLVNQLAEEAMKSQGIEKVIKCNCDEWEPNMKEVNKPWGLWFAHRGDEYKGKQFVYCPWCGGEL